MIEILPSILSADMARLAEEIDSVKAGGAMLIHVDVMDGHFVPNITIGPPVVASLRKATDLLLDVHLMIEEPDRYVPEFARAGANMISVHQEAAVHLDRTLNLIRSSGAEAGVAINPGTPVETITQVLEIADYVLVMTVNPGFGGQAFIPEMLRKIQNVRAMLGDRDLEVDGGIDEQTAPLVIEAGANVLVAGSYVFRSNSYMEAIDTLRNLGR